MRNKDDANGESSFKNIRQSKSHSRQAHHPGVEGHRGTDPPRLFSSRPSSHGQSRSEGTKSPSCPPGFEGLCRSWPPGHKPKSWQPLPTHGLGPGSTCWNEQRALLPWPVLADFGVHAGHVLQLSIQPYVSQSVPFVQGTDRPSFLQEFLPWLASAIFSRCGWYRSSA